MKGRKHKTSSHKWLRGVVYGLVAIVLICAGFLVFHKSSPQTHVTLSVPTPAPVAFVDSASANFVISSNMPDVNNNRTLSAIQPMIVSYNWNNRQNDIPNERDDRRKSAVFAVFIHQSADPVELLFGEVACIQIRPDEILRLSCGLTGCLRDERW